jgi:hypothetical protein
MTISPLAAKAKKVIDAAWLHGDAYDLSSQAAFALESTCMLQSPETAAECERLARQAVELQHKLEQAQKAAARAECERDLIRERVSEPYGCTYCGVAKGFHGRRYIGGAGMHGWERPSDEQVKDRMLARRAARFTSLSDRLAKLLVAQTVAVLTAEARIAELESERAAWRRTTHQLAGEAGLIPKSAEGEHYAATHHAYRVGRDLPEAGGLR